MNIKLFTLHFTNDLFKGFLRLISPAYVENKILTLNLIPLVFWGTFFSIIL